MDKDAIKGSLGQIDQQLENARDALQQLEGHVLNQGSEEDREEAEEMLDYYLTRAYELATFALEAGGLDGERNRLLKSWSEFRDAPNGLTAAEMTRWDSLFSKPLNHLESIVQGMRGAVGKGVATAEGFELSKLESILKNTAYLVRKRQIVPQSEKDIQDVMHDYLEAFFADYTRKLAIAKPIKTFIPDGGVPALKAAIEFKFATSKEQVKQEVGGIYEDMVGYSGSNDWTKFYTVLYQSDEFVSETAFREAIIRGGRGVWIPIIRTAPGKRKARKKKSSKKSP